MAKLKFYYPIEEVHGALKKKVFGAAKRKSANAKGGHPNFSVNYGTRKTEVTENEQANRDQFKAIATLVAARRNNAQKRVQDAAAFEAQTACPTLTKYLWNICTAEYLASQS